MNVTKWLVMVGLIVTMGFGSVVTKGKTYCPKLKGDEVTNIDLFIPYQGPRQNYLPGEDSVIGTTAYDYQANSGYGQRIKIDDHGQSHIDWMWQDYPAQSVRYCAWNARFATGGYYGESQASQSWSGYVQLDVTRDANPDSQRTVIAYHLEDKGTIDIDQGNLWGVFSNPRPVPDEPRNWPYICVASNNNIVMVTGNEPGGLDEHYQYLTTDEGNTWTFVTLWDSCAMLSQFLRASPNSGKVVHVWTQSMDLVNAKQWCFDVWYELSTDNGVTWGTPVNITNYTPPLSMSSGDSATWAFHHVIGVFDTNDDLHIAWSAHLAWVKEGGAVDTLFAGDRAKIFHWDEVSNTIHLVSSPSTYYTEPDGWWLEPWSIGEPYFHGGAAGTFRTIMDGPQLVVDPSNNDLYCLWSGNDDTTDVSANGYINGEIYGSKSIDGGVTWTNYTNLTNTRSPGAAAGECFDEDYMTANPLVVNDSIWVTFVEDKDACGYLHGGAVTENPVHGWIFSKELVGVEEHETDTPTRFSFVVYPNPVTNRSTISYALPMVSDVSIKLFSADGRLIRTVEQTHRPAGLYIRELRTNELANGTYFLMLETNKGKDSRSLVVVH